MATTTPFAYNTGAPISNTEQLGSLAIGTSGDRYDNDPGSVKWWMGPDQDLGYVIAKPVPGGRPTSLGTTYVAFNRSSLLTDASFKALAELIASQSFASAAAAKTWLNTNGYWTSYNNYPAGLLINLDAGNTTSYPGSGSTWTNLVDGTNYTINNGSFNSSNGGSIVFNGTSTYASIGTPLSGGTNYSIEAWVLTAALDSSRHIVSSTSNVFWLNNQTLSGGVGGPNSEVTSPSFPINSWRHVVLTFNDAANTMTLYINGAQVSQNVSVTSSFIQEELRIGAWYNFVSPVAFWSGRISQVRIYNQAISAFNVSSIYNSQKSRYGL